MKIFDFECEDCGAVKEVFMYHDFNVTLCEECGGDMHKIFTARDTTPIDASWVSGVREVVEKNSKKPWCNEFLKHPTRANLKEWMKKEGLRHRDPAEPYFKPDTTKERRAEIKRKMLEHYRETNALRVGGI